MTPEYKFVIFASRETLSVATLEVCKKSLGRCASVDRILELSCSSATYVLIGKSLQKLKAVSNVEFDSGLLDSLVLRHVHDKVRGARQARLLADVQRTFQMHAVSHIALRGRTFAERYYIDPACRASDDIDLLVPVDRRVVAQELLQVLDFEYVEGPDKRYARANYMGQIEFRHRDSGFRLDLNWSLSGNGGIGRVPADVDAVWARARHVAGSEYRLSPEDELLELLRHIGHGHDFATRVLKTCVDLGAFLRTESTLDVALFHRLAQQVECVQVVKILSSYYDEVYCADDDSLPRLGSLLEPRAPRSVPMELRLFTRAIITPLSQLTNRHESRWRSTAAAYLGVVAKLWATDSVLRLLKVLSALLFPPWYIVVLLSGEDQDTAWGGRRLRYLRGMVSLGPALVIGVCMRIVSIPMRIGK